MTLGDHDYLYHGFTNADAMAKRCRMQTVNVKKQHKSITWKDANE